MNKYVVILQLMKHPDINDETFDKSYEVRANSEWEAYNNAESLHSQDSEDIRHRSIFNYKVIKIK